MTSLRRCIIFQLIGLFLLFFFLQGCGRKESELGYEVLLRVGDRVTTVLDFKNAFDITKMAYDQNINQQPENLRKAQLRLLNELTVEMILLERAEELKIDVTDDELEKAILEITSDYPEGEFQETLLEFAVSYDSWKNRLKTRLILEKVMKKELQDRITITFEDISEYYKKNYRNHATESNSTQIKEDINEVIVAQLRRKKAEGAYEAWIEELKGKYTIEIDIQQWEKISGSKSIEENETDN